MKNKASTIICQQNKYGKFGCVSTGKKAVVIPFEYDAISPFRHEGKSHFLVNQDTKFGIFDTDGNEVVAMTEAINRPKLSKEIKQMFKIVYEYALHREESQQLLQRSFKKLCANYKKISKKNVYKIVLHSIFYDFIVKCYTLDLTKGMLLDILTDKFVGVYSVFQGNDSGKFSYSDVMERLVDVMNDNEWFIDFFTDYIYEIIPLSKVNYMVKSLETVDWRQYIITYLMGVVAENGEKF